MWKKSLRIMCVAMILITVMLQVACGSGGTASNSTTSAVATTGANSEITTTGNTSNLTESGFPIVKEKITLKGLSSKHSFQTNWGDMLVMKDMEEKSNIHIEWENVSDDVWTEKRNLILASGDLPDFICRSLLTDTEVNTYANQGVIMPLNDLIDKHAPNLNKLFQQFPNFKKAITNPEGKILGLASYNNLYPDYTQKMWINMDWANKLGMSKPTTLDEFYNYLLAVKEKNPGGVKGVVGLSDWSNDMNRFIMYFAGSFGLGTKGSDDYLLNGVDLGPDGKMRFAKIDPLYKEELQYLNKLWSAGLIDPKSFTHKSEDWVALGKNQQLAALQGAGISDSIQEKDMDKWDFLTQLKGSHGDAIVSGFHSGIWLNNTVFTTANKYPEATMRWFDFWYSEEGNIEHDYGIKDVSYTIDQDGAYYWTKDYDPSIVPIEKSRGLISPNFGGGLPVYVPSNEMQQGVRPWPAAKMKATGMDKMQAAQKALETQLASVIKNGVEPFSFTSEELSTIAAFKNEALQYVKEMETKFITGKTPFTEWDNYVKQVESMNLDSYMKVWNDANDRFNSVK